MLSGQAEAGREGKNGREDEKVHTKLQQSQRQALLKADMRMQAGLGTQGLKAQRDVSGSPE